MTEWSFYSVSVCGCSFRPTTEKFEDCWVAGFLLAQCVNWFIVFCYLVVTRKNKCEFCGGDTTNVNGSLTMFRVYKWSSSTMNPTPVQYQRLLRKLLRTNFRVQTKSPATCFGSPTTQLLRLLKGDREGDGVYKLLEKHQQSWHTYQSLLDKYTTTTSNEHPDAIDRVMV